MPPGTLLALLLEPEELADIGYMNVSIAAGAALAVLQKSSPPVQRAGVVAAVKRSALAVRFEGPVTWNETDEIVLIMSVDGKRLRATGRYVASQGDVHAFALATPWQPLNLRGAPRSRTNLYARVSSVLGQSRQDGRVVDVSLSGMAVWAPLKPGGGSVELMIASGGFTSHLRCEVVSAIPEASGVLLGLRYAELNHVQQAFVRQLVATAAAAEAAAEKEATRDAELLAS